VATREDHRFQIQLTLFAVLLTSVGSLVASVLGVVH
jgi:hypothetical protein